MKKNIILSTLLVATTLCFTGLSFAQPAPVKKDRPCKIKHERVMQRPDICQSLLTDSALNLTEKQKAKILKSDQKTRKQLQKYDDKIAKLKYKKHTTVRNHLNTLNETLTPEQKQILKEQHQRKMQEFIAKYKQKEMMKQRHKFHAIKKHQKCFKKPVPQKPQPKIEKKTQATIKK